MPNVKQIVAHTQGTGLNVYCIVKRGADGYLLNDADGTFAASPADPYLSLVEDAVIKGRYAASESRQAWSDGLYHVAIYRREGGSPNPSADTLVAAGEMLIEADLELTPFDYARPSDILIDPATDKLDGSMLDAKVSTRATAGDLVGQMEAGVYQASITVMDDARQEVMRGDVKKFVFNLGQGWVLTGKKVYFAAKADRTADNESAIVNRLCDITDALGGVAEITLTALETAPAGLYYAEVEVRDTDDTNPLTALQFELRIVQDVRH